MRYFSYEVIKSVIKLKTKVNSNLSSKVFFFKYSSIPLSFNAHKVNIYKGKGLRRLKINKFLIGYKFGNFVMTRKPFNFPIKTKKPKRK